MEKVLEIRAYDGRRYRISRPSKIGRTPLLIWEARFSECPEIFQDLELALVADTTPQLSRKISRSHCAIVPSGQGFDILDLNSTRGTKINGEDLEPFERHNLRVLDDVVLAEVYQFTVERIFQTANCHALLIGEDGGTLRGVVRDLDNMALALAKRGFELCQFYNDQSTKPKVLDAIDALSRLATSESRSILYFSGHGSYKGIELHASGREDSTLTPVEMFERISQVRGKKALILDCCHAGIFLEQPAPDNTLIIAAAKSEQKAYGSEGYFTRALIEFFKKNLGTFNLVDLKSELEDPKNCRTMANYGQQPVVGTGIPSYTIRV